ncbi:MAG: helix-turn-helix transcriptional regulator [Actinomycetota bacterium]
MLVGRKDERAAIDATLDRATGGRSSVLVLRGEPGIGKSALLGYAWDNASTLTRLRAKGIESESEIAFSGLLDLLRPVVDSIDRLPEPQRASLSGALALSPAMPGDRFTIYAACLGLLAIAAEAGPLAVVIDDLQWLDPPSAEALLFAGRRLEAEGVAMFITLRTGEGDWDLSTFEALDLSGLTTDEAVELIHRQAPHPVDPGVAERLATETRGNPLALTEIVRSFDPEALAGGNGIATPISPGPTLQKALARRTVGLPTETREALALAAASDTGAMEEITAALDALGKHRSDLDPAEDMGIFAITDGTLEFSHPLLRSAIYHQAPTKLRRSLHAALATVVERQDRRAWHLAVSAESPDETIAEALEEAATDASARSGYAAAAAALEKAARLSPEDEDRARRLHSAAVTYHLGGRFGHPLELLQEAEASTSDPVLRAQIHHLQGKILTLSGDPFTAAELLEARGDALVSEDPEKACLMLADASFAFHFTSRVERGIATARRAYAIAQEGPLEVWAGLNLAAAVLLRNGSAEARDLFEKYRPALDLVPPPDVWSIKAFVAQASGWAGEYDEADRLLEEAVTGARMAGAPAPLPYALAVACEVRYRMGDWARAFADGTEGARLGYETGQEAMAACNLITVGRIHAARGQVEDAHRTASEALQLTERLRTESLRVYIASFEGLLDLGMGNVREAVEELELARQLGASSGLANPEVVHLWADLVDAYLMAGLTEEAEETTVEIERYAAGGTLLTNAFAARCRAMLSEDPETYFERALRYHEDAFNPYEKARTLLVYGERQRRGGNKKDARVRLREARRIFRSLGAAPWIRRADSELAATGEKVGRPPAQGGTRLTPQELQVALAVADGATNREAAAALFLSPKTVEFHLSNVYSKLGLRSRVELATRVAEGGLAGLDPAQT